MDGPAGDGLATLYRAGVVTLAVVSAYELYQLCEAARQLPAFADRPTGVARYVAQQTGVHPGTVYRAINSMTRQI